MTIYIQYMVSIRCKLLVKSELDRLGITYNKVEIGEIDLDNRLSVERYARLKAALQQAGLVLIDDKKNILIEKIKHIIIEMIHYTDEPFVVNFSEFLSSKLHYNFNYLSKLFTEVKGIIIEHYIIAHKIERAKELLLYDELNLKEIAHLLNYSSVAHLSTQFKKMTGLTPTYFKQMQEYKKRITLENV